MAVIKTICDKCNKEGIHDVLHNGDTKCPHCGYIGK